MDTNTASFIVGGIGLVFALLTSGLWWILFRKTGHGAEWALVALLPLSGLFVIPIIGMFTVWVQDFERAMLINLIGTNLVGAVFGIAPLAVLVWRFVTGKVAFNVFD